CVSYNRHKSVEPSKQADFHRFMPIFSRPFQGQKSAILNDKEERSKCAK
ncbi:hypothetical protein DOT_0560, partial [Desulfosporosinus sp. OT]